MFGKNRMAPLYCAEEGEGEGGGGGATFTQADIDAAVAAAQGDVTGLRNKNQLVLRYGYGDVGIRHMA